MPLNVSGYIVNSSNVKSYSYSAIARRGLLLHLNASIAESYPETGTSWYDISDQLEYIDYLVVAGGGAGGHDGQNNDIAGGGGGAGGLLYGTRYRITSPSTLTVTVGGGGSGVAANSSTPATNGNNSVLGSITAIGGGRGGGYVTSPSAYYSANSGGSGGGGIYSLNSGAVGTSGQGNSGGNGTSSASPGAYAAGGGGGAGAAGENCDASTGRGGNGGVGLSYDIAGNGTVYYAGGGGGGSGYQIAGKTPGTGGLGGGGNGSATDIGTAGTANTGGGAGGSGNINGSPYPGHPSANGGSGIVVIRYKGGPKATGGTITKSNDYTIHTFTSSGTFTPIVKQNATLVNGPTFNNGAIVLDGTNDYITLPTTGFGIPSFSFDCWVKFNSTGNGAYWWSLADSAAGNPELRLGFDGSNKINYIWFDAGAYIFSTSSVATLTTNTWYHFANTTTNGQYIFYINGSVDKSLTGTTYDGGTIVSHSLGTYMLYGTTPYGGYSNMSVGAFRFYNRVLTATEISNNYSIERNRFGV